MKVCFAPKLGSLLCLALAASVLSALWSGCGRIDPAQRRDASTGASLFDEQTPVPAPISWLSQGVKLEAGGFVSKMTAFLYATDVPAHRSAVILSPGAKIPPAAMSGLATRLAETGRLVYVMQYAMDLAIIPTEMGKAGTFARTLIETPEKIRTLDARLIAEHKLRIPISVMGHSLGGAVLGQFISDQNSPFAHIALVGVDSLVKTPKEMRVPVSIIVGSNDGLMNAAKMASLEKALGTPKTILPEVNHFCIISDPSVGDPQKRADDKPTSLSSEQCVNMLTAALDRVLP